MIPRPVALVGATASGKSSVAMVVATRRPGTELVCVDSMTVYRGMDIGTAKPSPADRAAVPHHLLDLVDPGEEFSVADFQQAARAALRAVASRGRQALFVGGTGLYLRAVVDDLELPGRYPHVAAALEDEVERPGGLESLYKRLVELDPLAATRTTETNRRRIVRALEVTIGSGRPFSSFGPGLTAYPPTPVALVGLPYDPDVIGRRIEERLRRWVDAGLLDEVRQLATRPGGLSRTARQALGYRELLAHVTEGVPLEACVEAAVRRTCAFARRQMSWFRRDPRIRWTSSQEEAAGVVGDLLGDAPSTGTGRETVGMVHAATGSATHSPQAAAALLPTALGKHEATGNDFLVLVDAGAAFVEFSESSAFPAFARFVCDRRRGVGADGLLVARPGEDGADLEMLLYNADGSRAEMSGNGIRCLVQAAVMAGLVEPGTVRVRTDAGVRQVDFDASGEVHTAGVDMGDVTLGDELHSPLPGARARRASVGNPHVVVLLGTEASRAETPGPGGLAASGLAGIDLEAVAQHVVTSLGEPVNVEVVRRTGAESLALRVFERGVGETAACGTGSCAAAAVARGFGLVGDVVRVESSGGTVTVRLGTAPGEPVRLHGAVRHVADVLLAPAAFDAPALA